MTRRRKPFRWTRELYRRAAQATRTYDGIGFMYHGEPALVRRFRELWERHQQGEDPLLKPLSWRRLPSDDVPF